MYKNWELNYSPSRRYPSCFFNIQTTRITDLSKSINKIKKDENIQRRESYQYLKRNIEPESQHSSANLKRDLKSEPIKEEKIN